MTVAATATRGRLIIFEGPEGAGKTTQVARLADAMRAAGTEAVIVREPGATRLGERVRGLLLDSHDEIDHRAELFLFLAARAQLIPTLREHLASGTTVIADRFFLSTYAYQVAGRGLPADLVRAANALAVGDLIPDLTLLLTLPAGVGMARKHAAGSAQDRIERAGVDFHERVAAAFAACISPAWQQAHPECGVIVDIDASGAEPAVAARVRAAVSARWPELL